MKTKILSLILCVFMCMGVFAGCSGGSGDIDAFVIMTEQLDGLFNPFFYTSAPDGTIVAMTQIGMLSSKYVNGEVQVAYGENEAVVVKDYDIVENGDNTTTYTFVLKNGIKFSDGQPLTQSDLEDERKLFYVAVTRAKQNLYMTYELSAQPVSCFVKESAVSHHLNLDRSDLIYNPKADAEDFAPSFKNSYEPKTHAPNPEWEEERRQRQEYWATVKYARSQLYDYYGTGAHFCPAMYTMLGEIKKWSPDQILSEASKNGLI